ncbi:MAG: M24 family metallopeptidase, partial [Halioglobus sp.]
MSESAARLQALRSLLRERGYDACVVPRADEFLGEYIPAHRERLRWLTGFTGSAGLAVVTTERAALFVDGRYTTQVREQASEAHYEFLHLLEQPPAAWLCSQLGNGSKVACDPRLHSLAWFRETQRQLAESGVELVADADNLVDRCWKDVPEPVVEQAILLDEQFTGETAIAKRARIASIVSERGCNAALVFAPDAVSWLLNVRGMDMPQLPVLAASALLSTDGSLELFVDSRRLPEGFSEHVGEGVRISGETEVTAALGAYDGLRVLACPSGANAWWHQELARAGAVVVPGDDPVAIAKACKNPVELAGARAAHRRDAVAEAQFLAWLDDEVAAGCLHDEAVLSDKLLSFRAALDHFHACSFDTISAAAGNAAMAHYNHLNGTPARLQMNSVYLVDSGAQFTDGTTDITRTVAIGDPGDEVRRLFTLVLKGHIALAEAIFPAGTTGTQLDALARQFLWREGFDYDHGTGHGVGVFLSVHEGPQRISKASSKVALRPGMIVSNEPGYYRDGEFGMRCENLLAVVEAPPMGDGRAMLAFETLTLAPFDRRLLMLSLL